MYINLLYLLPFNLAYLFFPSFLSFLYFQRICQFYFHCFILQLAPCFSLVVQFVLQLVLFLNGRYNFWFPLFTRSIYCTIFLLDCFDFAYGCICICVYSVTLFIVVINLCLYVGLLQFCGVFLFSTLFSFLFHFLFSLFYNFKFFKHIIFFYIYSFVFLSYCSFPLAVNL